MNGKSGKVYLIGAGPGDYRLLTLKACDCLKMADTVVYDRLADERILQYAPRDAEFIYVGKASSQHTMTQDKICQLLVDLAKEGKTVVRLKGGDPFVFGRGGEEALLLQENGLPFEIVPGVTSAISVPAYAGIPVTHRGVAASFAVVTGPDQGKLGYQLAAAGYSYGHSGVPDGGGKPAEDHGKAHGKRQERRYPCGDYPLGHQGTAAGMDLYSGRGGGFGEK